MVSVFGVAVQSASMTQVEKIHLRAARFINRLKRNITDNNVLSLCNWKPIEWYYRRRIVCITHSIYNTTDETPLSFLIKKRVGRHATRNSLSLTQPSYKYTNYKASFAYRAAVLWNNLPDIIKQKSDTEFKNHLRKNVDCLMNILLNTTAQGRGKCNEFTYF